MEKIDKDEREQRETLDQRFKLEKQERLSEYQDRLENARGGKSFQKILEEFQEAQLLVDKELEKQRSKEEEKLKRDIGARRAKAKANAELKRTDMLGQVDKEVGNDQLQNGKLMIEEVLRQKE